MIHVAESIGVEPLVLSLILAPLATELPEKINSFFWIREGKDSLALGNITGAMVFQSTIPVAFGLAFTSWDLYNFAVVSGCLGLAGGVLAYATLRTRGRFELIPVTIWAAMGRPDRHRDQLEAAARAQRGVGEDAAREAKAPGDDCEAGEVPAREREAEGDRDRRLEDHRAGDVAEREAVLALADPEEAVDLLGQLGGERGEDQRQDERLDADRLGDVDHLLDEHVGAADDRRQPDRELDEDQLRRRLVVIAAIHVEAADRLHLLDLAAGAQRRPHVDR